MTKDNNDNRDTDLTEIKSEFSLSHQIESIAQLLRNERHGHTEGVKKRAWTQKTDTKKQ